MMPDCLLLLGANMGRREETLRLALRWLGRLRGAKVLKRSRFFDTAPVGPSARRFINLAIRYRTQLSPIGLLIELKRLEAKAGRRPGPRWGPRPLDIDILDYGKRRLSGKWLCLPHPAAARRAFVLAPVCDVAPGWKPVGKETARQILARLSPSPDEVRPLP
jgi:2-amino-4-hydroxy-6-hydroxymethyldihydropteridine diphosphokinase